MAEIIADTSALIAFFVRSEVHHQDAQQYMATHSRTRWVILESVFDETVTWFRVKVSQGLDHDRPRHAGRTSLR